jgi:mevalonate kinase
VVEYAQQARTAWRRYQQTPTAENFARLRGSDADHLLKCAVGETLDYLQLSPSGFELRIASDIPLNAGFGSSAALAVAVVAALLLFYHHPLDAKTVLHLAGESEKRQHGNPSGIDHHTVFYGGILQVRKDELGALQITPLSASLRDLRIYHSGTAVEATGATVAAVGEQMRDPQRSPLSAMKKQVEQLLHELMQPEPAAARLQVCLRGYQAALELLGVVPQAVQRVIRAVEAAGGAAKISGAGALSGDGAGCVIALCPHEVPKALANWPQIHAGLAATGLRVEQNND